MAVANKIILREISELGSEAKVDRDAGVIRGVKVLGLESANRRRYSPDAVRKAIPLYEGRAVNADHPARENPEQNRSIRDRMGWLSNVRESNGLVADLHLFKADPLTPKILEAAERNPASFGLSHNAEGRCSRTKDGVLVEEILSVRSVDLVGDPATTKSLFEEQDMADAATTATPADTIKQAFRDAILQIIDGDGELGAKKKAIGELLKQGEKAEAALSGEKAEGEKTPETPAPEQAAESIDALKVEVAKLKAREHARELLEAAGLKQAPEWVDAVALLESDEKRKAFLASLPRQPARARSGAPLPEGRSDKAPDIKSGKELAQHLTEGR